MKKKNPDNQIQRRKDDLQEYLHATLTVLSQENAEPGDCPDPEDLAAFAEGRLRGDEHKAIMVHIKGCTTCRRHWLMIQSALEEISTREATWKDIITRALKKLMPYRLFAGAGVGFAVATCLLLVVLLPQKDQLSKMISESYTSLSPSEIARYNAFVKRGAPEDSGQSQSEMMPEFYSNSPPGGVPRYHHFVDKGKDKDIELGQLPPKIELKSQSDALAAFKAGIAAGRAHLMSQTEATDTAVDREGGPPLLYSLGRWAVVLQCACISHEPASDEFWAEQEGIATKFQEELQNTVQSGGRLSSILKPVANISRAINQIRSGGDAANGCREIANALETIENQLRINPIS